MSGTGTLYSALPPASAVAPANTLLVSTPTDTINPFKTATPAQVAEAAFTTALGVAAAGSTQGTATALPARLNVVTAASAGEGVALGAAAVGPDGVVVVVNDTGVEVVVYPATAAGTINGGAAGGGVLVAEGGMATFIGLGGDEWLSR